MAFRGTWMFALLAALMVMVGCSSGAGGPSAPAVEGLPIARSYLGANPNCSSSTEAVLAVPFALSGQAETPAVTLPGVTTGDAVYVVVFTDGGSNTTSLSDGTNTYVHVSTKSSGGFYFADAFLASDVTGGTLSIHASATQPYPWGFAVDLTGVVASPLDGQALAFQAGPGTGSNALTVGPPSPDNTDSNAIVFGFTALVGSEFAVPGTGYAADPTSWGVDTEAIALESNYVNGSAPALTFTAIDGTASYFTGQIVLDQTCFVEAGTDSGSEAGGGGDASDGGGGGDAGLPLYVGGNSTETTTEESPQSLSYTVEHAGDYLVAGLYCGQGNTITGVTDSQGNTWHLAVSGLYGNPDNVCNDIYYAVAGSAGSDTVHVAYTYPDIYGTIMVAEYQNVTGVGGAATNSAYVYPISSGNITATAPGIIILVDTDDSGGDVGSDHGFTLRLNVSNNSALKDAVFMMAGTVSATSSATETDYGLNIMGFVLY